MTDICPTYNAELTSERERELVGALKECIKLLDTFVLECSRRGIVGASGLCWNAKELCKDARTVLARLKESK